MRPQNPLLSVEPSTSLQLAVDQSTTCEDAASHRRFYPLLAMCSLGTLALLTVLALAHPSSRPPFLDSEVASFSFQPSLNLRRREHRGQQLALTPVNSVGDFLHLEEFQGDEHQTKKLDNVALEHSMHPLYQRRSSDARMQEGERERKQSRGRSATIARPVAKPKDATKEKVDVDGQWSVLLHNDDIHTFEYVNMAIVDTVTTVTRKKAHRIVVAAHSNNMAVVTQTWKQQAKTYCLELQKYGLTSSIAPAQKGEDDGGK